MFIRVDEIEFEITWEHCRDFCINGKMDSRGGATNCFLSINPTGETFIGTTKCHPRETFCKATGRKVSFGKALDKVINYLEKQNSPVRFGAKHRRDIRRKFWQAYFLLWGITYNKMVF